MSAATLSVEGLDLSFGAVQALQGVEFDAQPRELLAIIGPNGAGKSSLFNVLTRMYHPERGSARLDDVELLSKRTADLSALGVARSFQNLGLCSHQTALTNVMIGRHHHGRAGAFAGGLRSARSRREERANLGRAHEALAMLDIADIASRPVGELPYGVRKRVELARCIASEPRLLLLDEPAAGMTAAERQDIVEVIASLRRERELTILLVEHDVGMVMQVADRVLVLDFGIPIALGPPAQIQANPAVISAYLGEEVPT